MSLSRSPSPHPGGGWSSPGLTPGSGSSTPRGYSPASLTPGAGSISWATAKAKSDEVRGYPSFSTRNSGFFSRQKHKISRRFSGFRGHASRTGYVDKDAFGRGNLHPGGAAGHGLVGAFKMRMRRGRSRTLFGLFLLLLGYLCFWSTLVRLYRRSPLGGGRKFVIILGSNVEGGVMEWKGAREWAIERNSIWNKQQYVEHWGYELEVANMLAKKRYSHEWRESWEKGDVIREAMRKYPHAEWFWWLDLNTWVMEHDTSLQSHIFNDLESNVYRDINAYNPLNMTHPLPEFWLDDLGRALEGDENPESLNLLLTQDCSGFNLGSFFLRRSLWADRLLDAWWDPVMYEQMHMEWEHKEQNALEYIYQSQAWIRSSVGFLPQRSINAFPLGACGDENNPTVHYQEEDHDFVVNMAGCMFGRDCWSEVYNYREISKQHNRTRWARLLDHLHGIYGWAFKTDGRNGQ
ncbi:hypothetical protein N7462_000770 [Penicillium macrosclerotiorum]|uniref:uncharacterized protein n=1 Tax=Penicillium macrosclerotiorum TaxID=303699 RepID=UPI002548B528|nr:uncharacterized protein N7462_000770 [Penicillium macrosclerotiorum]KAJ5698765.1 hypothetical protein N7462_000770 [Penicillium macrosclerotiorum]